MRGRDLKGTPSGVPHILCVPFTPTTSLSVRMVHGPRVTWKSEVSLGRFIRSDSGDKMSTPLTLSLSNPLIRFQCVDRDVVSVVP